MQIIHFEPTDLKGAEDIIATSLSYQLPDNQSHLLLFPALEGITGQLEEVANAFFSGKQNEALSTFEMIKQKHLQLADSLLKEHLQACLTQLNDLFTEVEWLLHDQPVRQYNYYYDQIVCIGELLSSCIISHYFSENHILNLWVDIRDILRTDNHFGNATIDLVSSTEKVLEANWTNLSGVIITQNGIGATADNESTTLGKMNRKMTAEFLGGIHDYRY